MGQQTSTSPRFRWTLKQPYSTRLITLLLLLSLSLHFCCCRRCHCCRRRAVVVTVVVIEAAVEYRVDSTVVVVFVVRCRVVVVVIVVVDVVVAVAVLSLLRRVFVVVFTAATVVNVAVVKAAVEYRVDSTVEERQRLGKGVDGVGDRVAVLGPDVDQMNDKIRRPAADESADYTQRHLHVHRRQTSLA